MEMRQRLIDMINPNEDDWQPTVLGVRGKILRFDPTYYEYMKLQHQLGLEENEILLFPEGGDVNDEDEKAEQNRAIWRKWIDEHHNDDFFVG